MIPDPIVFPEDPYWKEAERQQQEAWRFVQKTLRETGMLPKWELFMRNPKFAAAVAAEAERILGEAADELAKRRGIEYGILLQLQAHYEAQRKARIKRLQVEPRGLGGLRGEHASEQAQNTTYGKGAELRSNLKHWAKGRRTGDRLVIVGTLSGAELKEVLKAFDPRVSLSEIRDEETYGGDLLVIGLETRNPHQRRLWGRHERYSATKTVQMKWGETTDPNGMLKMITYAGIQLAGLRDERPVPGSLRVISVGVLNPAHPWNTLDGTSAAMLIPYLEGAFAGGLNQGFSVPREGLHGHVDRIVIRTQNWTFRFAIEGNRICFASATHAPNQHAELLAEPRPAKNISGERRGMLIIGRGKGGAFIQVTDGKAGQKTFKLDVPPSGLNHQDPVVFTVDPKGNVTSIRRA
ncbi:hypothetical protein [Corallococcus sp. 4LFB]|uniref:hypothetical protein n=1 Tax=Corallococcus sp. 4LFB TaxID=3383249 RepID=UPI003976E396